MQTAKVAIPFEVSVDIVRPANTNTYTIGDLVADKDATTLLPALDFSVYSPADDHVAQINSIVIKSDYAAASPKLTAQVFFYTKQDIQASCADEAVFAPSYANHIAYCSGRCDDVSNSVSIGTYGYETMQTEMLRLVKLNAAKTYPAIVASNAYVGKSGEKIRLTIKGILI